MTLFSMAFRNLLRNARRTLLTGAAISLGIGLMIVAVNLTAGQWVSMLGRSIEATSGHVVVQPVGYVDDPKPDMSVVDSGARAATLAAIAPEARVLRRAVVGGLLTSPTSAGSVSINGVLADVEAEAHTVDQQIVEGSWLVADDPQHLVIGRTLADALGVQLGDKVVFMAQGPSGDMESALFRVRGLYDSGMASMDGFLAYTHLSAVQGFLPGDDPATQIAVQLPDDHRTAEVLAAAEAAIDGDDAEVLDWQGAMPTLYDQMQLDKNANHVVFALLGVIVVIGILNTVLMSVLERTREFGVLLAIGMQPGRLFALVVLENTILGLVAGGLGVVFGLLGTWPLATYGIDFGDLVKQMSPKAGVSLDTVMYATYDWPAMAGYGVAAVVVTLLASLWPAWRATRLRPVDAMRAV